MKALAALGVWSAVALSPVVAQTTWTVGPTGQFTSIQPAIDAASPGDTILVDPAGSPYDADIAITKGIYLLGQGQVPHPARITIHDVPLGQHVTVKNFDLYEDFLTHYPIACRDCRGTIHFEQVRTAGSIDGPALTIERCLHVSGADCTFTAGVTYVIRFGGELEEVGSDTGAVCTDGNLHLARCSASGLVSLPAAFAGLDLTRSRAVVVDCSLDGGRGYDPFHPFCFAVQPPSSALAAKENSTVIIKGGTLTGGVGICNLPNAVQVSADASSIILLDAASPLTVSGGQVSVLNIHDLQTAGAAPGNPFAVTLSTAAAGTKPYAVWASLPGRPILAPQSLWLDLAFPVQLFAGTVDASVTVGAVVPLGWPEGFPIALQAVLLVNNQLELSTPAVLILH